MAEPSEWEKVKFPIWLTRFAGPLIMVLGYIFIGVTAWLEYRYTDVALQGLVGVAWGAGVAFVYRRDRFEEGSVHTNMVKGAAPLLLGAGLLLLGLTGVGALWR